MECANCELRQRQLYCENCINSHIRDVRLQITRVASDRDDHVHKASSSSESIAPNRLRRADLASGSERLEDVKEALARLRRENDKSRARLRSLRESLATRRRTLSQARLLSLTSTSSATHQSNPTSPSSTPVPSNSVLDAQISRELQQLSLLSDTLARARSGLVSELVEVFNIVEVGGRPPIGRKAGIKGEWTIEGLVLPVPGDIRRYPPDHVNAVITHTIHFLGLLTFYLGVKLPFETSWSGKKLGVGQPWIRSIKGTENGSWAKWTSKHCLHVSTTSPANPRPSTPPPTHPSTPPPQSTSTSTSPPSPPRPNPSHRSRTTSSTTTSPPPHKLSSSRRQPSLNVDKDMTESLSASYIEASLPSLYSPITSPPRARSRTDSTSTATADPPRSYPSSNAPGANKDPFNTTAAAAQSSSTSAHGSFTTAYTMLLYDVAYLAWTQGVDVGLSQAGEVLANLVRVCGAGDVGRRSHATFSRPPLSQPTPPSFPLDFAQLLQVQAQASAFRDHGRGAHRNRATTVQTSSSQAPGSSGGDGKGAGAGGAGAGVVMRKESMDDLEEVEDEWDLVDERDGEEGEGEADADGLGVGGRKREGGGWG